MSVRLVVCHSCSQHVAVTEPNCVHCGTELVIADGHFVGRTAVAVLMGLSLAGCPADDESESGATTDAVGESAAAYGNPESESDSLDDTATVTPTTATSSSGTGGGSTGDGSEGSGTSTGGDSDTDSSSGGSSSGSGSTGGTSSSTSG
ncbi:MAG: hypothetical protein ACRBN8_27605 [Nannocystales bacterium]